MKHLFNSIIDSPNFKSKEGRNAKVETKLMHYSWTQLFVKTTVNDGGRTRELNDVCIYGGRMGQRTE